MAINGLFEDLWEFIDVYFWNAPGYNIVNTPVYAIIALIMVYFCYRVVESINSRGEQKWGEEFSKIAPDGRFLVSLLPIMLTGGAGRAFNDAFFSPNLKLLVTPWIFFFLIFFTIAMIIVSIVMGARFKVDWHIILACAGTVLLLIFLIPLFIFPNIKGTTGVVEYRAILPVILLFMGIVTVFIMIRAGTIQGLLLSPIVITVFHFFACISFSFDLEEYLRTGTFIDTLGMFLTFVIFIGIALLVQKQELNGEQYKLMMRDNFSTLSAQLFDAVVSYVSITFYSYEAKQLITDFLFSTLGKWSFITAKLLLVTALVISLDFFWENKTQAAWIKWALLIVSVGTGSRDFLRIITAT